MRLVKLTLIAAVLAAIGTCTEADYVGQFELFKKLHKRHYASPSEEAMRLGFFVRNMQEAAVMQSLNPHASFGMNSMSDMSDDEFKTRHNGEGHFRSALLKQRKTKPDAVRLSATFDQVVDWRAKGAVTAVKNQEMCGGCWSFSTTGNIEGQWQIAGNGLVSLSEQELISCDNTCNGCHGGLMDDAFEWLISTQNGGITSEAQYPFVSQWDQVPACDMTGKTPVAFISGYKDLPHDENQMAAWLAGNGPVSIAVDATSLKTYTGGVITNCQAVQVDHAILAVGFDLTASPPYWIVKNSWGTVWGENGFGRIEFGQNECLITTYPTTSIVSSNPPPVPPPGPPAPPAPTVAMFTQSTCTTSTCTSGCQASSFPTTVCLPMAGGTSAIVTCGTSNLHLNAYSTTDCTGTAQASTMPLDQCLQDNQGSYMMNTCGASSQPTLSDFNHGKAFKKL